MEMALEFKRNNSEKHVFSLIRGKKINVVSQMKSH